MTENLTVATLVTCRICRADYGDFQTMNSKLGEILNYCTHLGAVIGDELPQMICMECVNHLMFVEEFIQRAMESDKVFRQQLVLQKKVADAVDRLSDTEKSDELCEVLCVMSNEMPLDDAEIIEHDLETSAYHAKENGLVETSCFDENSSISCASDERDDLVAEEYLSNSSCHSNDEQSYADFEYCDDYDTSVKIVEISRLEPESCTNATPIENLLVECKHCHIVQPNAATLKQHIVLNHYDKNKSERRNFRCPICDKCFSTQQKLKQHNLVHTKAKDFACPICGKCFATVYRQRNHTKTHTDERNFMCEFCDKRFVTRFQVNLHMVTHNNFRPHKCGICGMAFQQHSVLKTHMALHEGKTIECDLCQHKFSRRSQLKIHQRLHTGDRPYKCTYCNCAYMQKSHLDRHVNVHRGIRFECGQCKKNYTKKSSLDTHIQQEHLRNKTFTCQLCSMVFNKQKGYYYHMKKKHPDGRKVTQTKS